MLKNVAKYGWIVVFASQAAFADQGVVVIGSFIDRDIAQDAIRRVRETLSLDATILEAEVDSRQWFRVVIEAPDSRVMVSHLRENGFPGTWFLPRPLPLQQRQAPTVAQTPTETLPVAEPVAEDVQGPLVRIDSAATNVGSATYPAALPVPALTQTRTKVESTSHEELIKPIEVLPTGPVLDDPVFGINAGIGSWQQTFSGDITSGITQVDVEDDLALEDENNNIFYLALEHGVPVLPNIRVQHAKVAVSGNSTLTRTIGFNGTIFNLDDAVATDVELNQTGLVLYYEVLDNVISLDIGMGARQVEGFFEIATTLEVARAEFDGVLPLLYGKVRADLPLTGLWLGAEVQGLGYDGNRLIDANVQVGWKSPLGLGVEGGWRIFQLDLVDFDDVSSGSLDISGPYFALNYHF